MNSQNWYFDDENSEGYHPCWNYTTQGFNSFPCNDIYYKAISPFPTEAYTHGANWEAEYYVPQHDFNVSFYAGIKWVIEQEFCNPAIWNSSKAWHDQWGVDGNKGEIQINTRWIGADCIWLSPAYSDECENGIPISQIGIYIPGEFDAQQPEEGRPPDNDWFFWNEGYYKAINKSETNFVRVHWGKASLRKHSEIEKDYPKMNDFINLRNELDPNQTFVNQEVRDKLGLCDCAQNGGTCCCTNDTCNLYIPVAQTYSIKEDDWVGWFNPESTEFTSPTESCQPSYYRNMEPTVEPTPLINTADTTDTTDATMTTMNTMNSMQPADDAFGLIKLNINIYIMYLLIIVGYILY